MRIAREDDAAALAQLIMQSRSLEETGSLGWRVGVFAKRKVSDCLAAEGLIGCVCAAGRGESRYAGFFSSSRRNKEAGNYRKASENLQEKDGAPLKLFGVHG
jgi:hypothetical protein